MKKLGYRYQRTVARPAEANGVGYLTGSPVRLRFHPAPADHGVVFVRADLRQRPRIAAHVSQVSGTQRRTTLGQAPAQVELVEHVLAALAGLHIDNCLVELHGVELPGLDGSAQGFVSALLEAGSVMQPARRAIWTVTEPVVLQRPGSTLAIYPCTDNQLRITYILDYGPQSPIMPQRHTQVISPERFIAEIAPCRTFLLQEEALELRRQGIGTHTTTADLVVFGPRGPIDNTLRFADEPARHKVLDVVGDLSLLGHDLRGHVVAYRSGHPLNVEMARVLSQELSQAGTRPSKLLQAA